VSRFDYVAYDDQATKTQAYAKQMCRAMEGLISTLPGGRATSLALTKLEECYMWIGKAVRDDQVARLGAAAVLQEGRSNG
jgi:hypothetical protein